MLKRLELELRLVKSANKAGLLKTVGSGIYDLVHRGLWGRASDLTAKSTGWFGKGLHRASNLFYNPVTRQRTGLNNALTYYGLAGMAEPLTGISLPGSNAAFMATAPGAAGLFMVPNLVTTARASTAHNQGRLKSDVLKGGDQAKLDFITATQADPSSVRGVSGYENFMRNQGYDFGMADRYAKGAYNAPGWLSTISGVFNNPQQVINDRTDKHIMQYLGKQASIGRVAWPVLGKLWGGLKYGTGKTMQGVSKGLPWVTPVAAVGLTGYYALRDKPYSEGDAAERGYAAAQNQIRDKLGNLNFMERMALKMDPTLAVQKLEETMPGSIKQWEGQMGAAYRPGWLSRAYQGWNTGGGGKYYTYDVTGGRRYI